jgi:transposase
LPRSHVVRLTPEQRTTCREVLTRPDVTDHTRRRAIILIRADASPDRPHATDREIADAAGVAPRTVARVRANFVTRGFDAAMNGMRPPPRIRHKLTPEQEQLLLDLLDTPPPLSFPRWTTRTLAERLSQIEGVPSVSRELVRRTLKRHNRTLSISLMAVFAIGAVDVCGPLMRLAG